MPEDDDPYAKEKALFHRQLAEENVAMPAPDEGQAWAVVKAVIDIMQMPVAASVGAP